MDIAKKMKIPPLKFWKRGDVSETMKTTIL
jgi:hypothetical protein